MALKVFGIIWCVVMATIAFALAVTGSIFPALWFAISAILASPPTWRILSRYGVAATRKVQVVSVVGTYLVGAVVGFAINPHPFGVVTPGSGGSTTHASISASPEGAATCEGIAGSSKDFAVANGGPLRERADDKSAQVTMAFGITKEVKPVAIDTTMPVRELCRSGQWSFISILQLPSDIGNGKGWVPTRDLRPVSTDKSGRRIYGPSDFEWPDGSKPYRKAVLTVVNRVMSQNPRCDAFNSQSILMDKDRAGPLFKAACFGATEQIVDFRPDDATNGRDFTPVDPIDEKTARVACWDAAKARASHPSTVDIATFDGQFQSDDSGGSSYRTTFTAKNSFNLTLNFTILCTFKGAKFVDVDVNETAG